MTNENHLTPRTVPRINPAYSHPGYGRLQPSIYQAKVDKLTVLINNIDTNFEIGDERTLANAFQPYDTEVTVGTELPDSFIGRNGTRGIKIREEVYVDGIPRPLLFGGTMRFIQRGQLIRARLDLQLNPTRFIRHHGTDVERLRQVPARELILGASQENQALRRALDGNDNYLSSEQYHLSAPIIEELYAIYWQAVMEAFWGEINSRFPISLGSELNRHLNLTDYGELYAVFALNMRHLSIKKLEVYWDVACQEALMVLDTQIRPLLAPMAAQYRRTRYMQSGALESTAGREYNADTYTFPLLAKYDFKVYAKLANILRFEFRYGSSVYGFAKRQYDVEPMQHRYAVYPEYIGKVLRLIAAAKQHSHANLTFITGRYNRRRNQDISAMPMARLNDFITHITQAFPDTPAREHFFRCLLSLGNILCDEADRRHYQAGIRYLKNNGVIERIRFTRRETTHNYMLTPAYHQMALRFRELVAAPPEDPAQAENQP
jgi:hypothetical protein